MGRRRSKFDVFANANPAPQLANPAPQLANPPPQLEVKEVEKKGRPWQDFDDDMMKDWDRLDFNFHKPKDNKNFRGRVAICTCEKPTDTCHRVAERKRKSDVFTRASDYKCERNTFCSPCFRSKDVKNPHMRKKKNSQNVVLRLQKTGDFECRNSYDNTIRGVYPDAVWAVERILLTRRVRGDPYQRLVLWQGYGFNEITWEHESQLAKCTQIKADFARLERDLILLSNLIGRDTIIHDYPGYIEMYELNRLTPGGLYAKIAEHWYNHFYNAGRPRIVVENWTTQLAELNVNFITKSLYTKEAENALKDAEKDALDNRINRYLHLTRAAYKHNNKDQLRLKTIAAIQATNGRCCSCEGECKIESDCPCYGAYYKEAYKESPGPNHFTECHKSCNCKASKKTMVGPKYRFMLFYTTNAGWSVRTLQPIKEKEYVMEYIGTVCLAAEAKNCQDDSYLFECHPPAAAYLEAAELSKTRVDSTLGKKYVIDATKHGDISRFINHHCNPNLYACTVQGREHDLSFLRVVFFTKRAIQAGEELTFNYFDSDIIDNRGISKTSPKCHCGDAKCRKYLITGKDGEGPSYDKAAKVDAAGKDVWEPPKKPEFYESDKENGTPESPDAKKRKDN